MDYVALHARLRPGSPAVRDLGQGRDWNYAGFDRLVAGCVSVLRERGIERGLRVACLSRNRVEIVVLHLACARLGVIFVPLNWRLSGEEIGALIADCRPSLIYGDDMAQQAGIQYQDIGLLLATCEAAPAAAAVPNDSDLPSLILYTSGTTGKPKGVLLSERNLEETAINFLILGRVDASSHVLCESPMFHIIGLVTSVRSALLCGARITISDGFVPERTLARLADPELALTHYFCVPQMARTLKQSPQFDGRELRGLTALFTGGAPHPRAQILEWLHDGVAVVDGYGSSEAGTVFGMPLDRDVIARKAGSVGLPTPRVEVRIVDASGEMVLTAGQPGELQLRGDNVSRGYWHAEAGVVSVLSEDGWFATGDVAQVDEDGFYYIVDRKKDMFISGGENVYPAEIEGLLTDLAGVDDIAVVGVPDEQWGEVGCVFYASRSRDLTVEEVAGHLDGRLARYKLPRRTWRVEWIPRSAAGKVLKPRLRSLLSGGEAGE